MHDVQSGHNSVTSGMQGVNAPLGSDQPQWYALQTRPRHEKKVVADLQEKGVTTYLPLLTQMHRWSDRRKVVHVPLFSCYTFIHSALGPEVRTLVSRIWGALGFVGPNHHAVPIPEKQIENIRILLASNIGFAPYPFLKAGQRVRIRGGTLDGIEGILVANGKQRLVISVETISHSLSVNIEGQNVEQA